MASSSTSIPRVNHAMLKSLVGQTVRVVGRVIETNDGIVVLQAADNGNVTIQSNYGGAYTTQFAEVVGRVNDDLSLQEMQSVNFGNDFDMSIYAKMLELTNGKYRDLFNSV